MDIIWDDDAWTVGASKLIALVSVKVPIDFIDLHTVDHFHEIIDLFEKATRKDLSTYRIDSKRLARKRVGTGFALQPYVWSKEKFCPSGYFSQQVTGFFNYIHLFRKSVIAQHKDIMERADEMKSEIVGKFAKPTLPASPVNISIGTMTNSTVTAHSRGATIINKTEASDPEFKKVLKQINDALPSLEIAADDKKQISAELTTIEAQIESPAPKYTIVSESFNSIRSILEGVAGNVISSGLMIAINAYLGRF